MQIYKRKVSEYDNMVFWVLRWWFLYSSFHNVLYNVQKLLEMCNILNIMYGVYGLVYELDHLERCL